MSALSPRRLDWETEGRGWPHRQHSHFVTVDGTRWHVQSMGNETAPAILLLHGTGASTHSFRKLMPLLSEDFRVVALDLPGHGFTVERNARMLSLRGMAAAIAELLRAMALSPVFACGHSAGAAILLRMALDDDLAAARLFGINSALTPIQGHSILSPLAKLLFANPFVPRVFSAQARFCDAAGGLLRTTGSTLGADDKRYYEVLLRNSAHVAGALGMMAGWNVAPLISELPRLRTPVSFLVAEDDRMVSPESSRRAARQAPDAEIVGFATGGHLLHEVDPEGVARTLLARMAADG